MDRTLRGLHKNDSTAHVGEFRKLFFLKNTYGIQTKIFNLSLKKHFPHLNSKGHVLMTRAPQKDRARIQQRFVTEFVENHSSYWFLLFQICQRILSILEINICFSRQ